MSRISKFAWFILIYNLMVIVLGGFVRASGSGAGCGSHWPLCNGVVVPQAPAIQTIIEFTHRITSGLTVVLILALLIWTWRSFSKGAIVRWTSGASVFFIFTESLLGAGLVLFHLVEDNDSIVRAISMMVHLVNTFLLLGALASTAWFLTFGQPQKMHLGRLNTILFGLGVLGIFILGASGAVAALGDTLFPATSLAEGFQQEFAKTAHYLLRLRVLHPPIAILVGLYVAWVGRRINKFFPSIYVGRISNGLFSLVVLQLGFGLLNVWLLAPIWLQLVHLLMTSLIWIAYILTGIAGGVAGYLPARIRKEHVQNRIKQPAAE
jgi:heme A synthase